MACDGVSVARVGYSEGISEPEVGEVLGIDDG